MGPPETSVDLVALVDRRDTPLGVAPKLDVHRDGRLHRAVSVLLVDDAGRVLLQRRAEAKYHSAGLWSNACCGHPRPDEPVIAWRWVARDALERDLEARPERYTAWLPYVLEHAGRV